MKHKFTTTSVAEWIIGFLQYACDSRDEITMILEKVLEAFPLKKVN